MTADNEPTLGAAPPARAIRPVAPLPVAGGALGCAALLAALIVGPGGTPVPTAVLGVLAMACLGTETVRRGLSIVREAGGLLQPLKGPTGPRLALAGLAIAIVIGTIALTSTLDLAFVAVAALLAIGSGFLIGRGIEPVRSLPDRAGRPWGTFRGDSRQDRARHLLATLGPPMIGVLLGLLALGAANGQSARYSHGAIALLVVVSLGAASGVAAWRQTRTSLQSARRGEISDQVAAHLHDSVLQTLALIQRNATDATRVAQLARQQEQGLRDWLAGRGDTSEATLAGALRAAAIEVESEVAGARVDLVCVGDAPLGRHARMLVDATREAMRNAARHGSPHVRVFAESDERVATIYVRDTGGGFVLDEMPVDRRGVRDAIIGRMEHIGGKATIESGEQGTEVELRLPARPS